MNLSVIILAAGQGTRMRSSLPKVLHPLGGKPMLERIVSTVAALSPKTMVVVHGEHKEQLQKALHVFPTLRWAHQAYQRGTGDAVKEALPYVGDVEKVLIVYGDVPLISIQTLQALINKTAESPLGLVTVHTENPYGLGRILRDKSGNFQAIVEEKDASELEKRIQEINTGIWLVSKQHLTQWLPKLTMNNVQREYYLTDIAQFAREEHHAVVTVASDSVLEVLGVNTKTELALVERTFQKQEALKLMKEGVTLMDPARLDVRGELTTGQDVTIDVNAIFEGRVHLGDRVQIGANVIIKNSIIHEDAQILANTIIEDSIIGQRCLVGPFARIRPGTELSTAAKIGNFVEIKNAKIGDSSKINHLSYIGDAQIGQNVNVGAGTITCNYDGIHKHSTIIENDVFIGSDTQLIAPVTIGTGATIGAGTTVVKDVPANQLIHHKIQYRTVVDWKKPDIDNQ